MIDVEAVHRVFGRLAPAVLGEEEPPPERPRCPICGALGKVERIEVPLLEDPWFTVPGRSRCPNEGDAEHREARLLALVDGWPPDPYGQHRREVGHRSVRPAPFIVPALEKARRPFLEQLIDVIVGRR